MELFKIFGGVLKEDKYMNSVGDMQQYYDDLVLMRKTLDAQIDVLGNDASVCTHKKIVDIGHGVKICANKYCDKVVDSGIYDWVK